MHVKTNHQAPSKVDVGSASLLPQALYPNAYDATTPARAATASHLRKPKLPRRCRECVHEVDSIIRRQAVCEATHPDRDGPYGHVFATILGRRSCATMSSHTCYRTSRSFHFPFWAVCSLSGTQPEFSLGRLHPHVEKDILSLFVASSQFSVLRASRG